MEFFLITSTLWTVVGLQKKIVTWLNCENALLAGWRCDKVEGNANTLSQCKDAGNSSRTNAIKGFTVFGVYRKETLRNSFFASLKDISSHRMRQVFAQSLVVISSKLNA